MKFLVSTGPHLHSKQDTTTIMRDVIIALTPAAIASVVFFGIHALHVIITAIIFCLLTEFACQKLLKKELRINDLSAVVTGLLLAMCLPPSFPLWGVALGSIFAIAIVKELFGGLGFNIFNPALAGRAFLLASYPVLMTSWQKPFDVVTGATALGALQKAAKSGVTTDFFQTISLKSLIIGNVGGSLGETSAILLLVGVIYLLIRRVISLTIPLSYLGTFALLIFIFGGQPILWHLFAGGLIIGAFYMATDYTTSPMTIWGKIIFGIGCGVLTYAIRFYGGYPEGVCYVILIMNITVPLLDKIGDKT